MLLGFKAIVLHPELSGGSKAVGAIILDHYNKKTGQCDPSINRLTNLSGLNKSSVIRAIKELGKMGLITRISHGGGHERNRYLPSFDCFKQIEESWKNSFKNGSIDSVSDACHSTVDLVLESGVNLPLQELQYCDGSLCSDPTLDVAEMRNKPILKTNTENLKNNCLPNSNFLGNVVKLDRQSTRAQAALNRAEVRLTELINKHPQSSLIWTNCTEDLYDEAVRLEMRRRGTGIAYLINELTASLYAKSQSSTRKRAP